ncbi:MAG TPA: NAD-dependent epimerase/dehydratase family protein, partial [Bacteroidales bacterium]|nr:NAD-dependent epimerase/dehydratase family protein [Bacteroidales bacterium]
MKKIMVIGALGQIGSELTVLLRQKYGVENVIATDWKTKTDNKVLAEGPLEYTDVMDKPSLRIVIEKHQIDAIIHMAAILSATGEEHPNLAWNVNMGGLYNVL